MYPIKSEAREEFKGHFFFIQLKVSRYSFSGPYRYVSIALKMVFSLSDRYKIFASNWLWIEIRENVVLRTFDITMTTINKKV